MSDDLISSGNLPCISVKTIVPYLVIDICLEQMDSNHILILKNTDGQGKQHHLSNP